MDVQSEVDVQRRGESKLGKPCPRVRLSQDRLPIEPFARMMS